MGFFDTIKGYFSISDEQNAATKAKLRSFMMQATKADNLNGYEIVYGKHINKDDTVLTNKTTYFNYAIAFNDNTGALTILPIDPKLASCGWPVFINNETLVKAQKVLMNTLYEFTLKDGDDITFDVPAVNYKISVTLGALELPISQEKEAAAFKAFFERWFK